MITYLIKTLLCSGILLMVYFLFLEKEKMHRFNRWYLLLGLVFAFLIPFIVLQGKNEVIPFAEPAYLVNSNDTPVIISVIPQKAPIDARSNYGFQNILLIVYAIVTLLMLFRFFRNLLQLRKIIRSSPKLNYSKAILILADDCPVPYSFLNYIFISKEDHQNKTIEKEILHHELAHVQQKHTWDVLFTELLLCFIWFNPFLYGFRKAIQLNHEFLADDAVIKTFRSTRSYQYLLLNKTARASHSLLTSSFNYLTTKKRLIMMTKTVSPLRASLKQLLLLPLLASLVFLFSTKLVAQDTGKTASPKKEDQRAEKDTAIKPGPWPWIQMSIGYTKEGAPEELLKEYHDIIHKYKTGDTLKSQNIGNISKEDRSRMETIFKQMNFEQQSNQDVAFLKQPPPAPKVVPTKTQFESFKNPKVYGLWINEKKVSNDELNKYKNTDFSLVSVSKLYGAAKKGKSYTHQVNMMTNDFYQEYYKNTKAKENESIMVFVHRTKKGFGFRNVE